MLWKAKRSGILTIMVLPDIDGLEILEKTDCDLMKSKRKCYLYRSGIVER